MSFMDKIKSFFSGGSAASADDPAALDPIAEPTSTPMGDPAAAPVPPDPAADPAGMPTSDAAAEAAHGDEEHDHSDPDHTH